MLLVMTMTTVSCTKSPNIANQLVGTWECTANSADNVGTGVTPEAAGSLKGACVTFKDDGTFMATSELFRDGALTGYWSISQEQLHINALGSWRVKSFTESDLKIETFLVDGMITPDTTGNVAYNGPFKREFKKK